MATKREPLAWYSSYWSSYQAGESHAFILSGDIEGTAFEDVSQKNLLLVNLAATRHVVAVWHIASGIKIYDPDGAIKIDSRNAQGREIKVDTTRKQRALALIGANAPEKKAAPTGALGSLMAQATPQANGSGDPFADATRVGDALALLTKLLLVKDGNVAVVIDYADALVPQSVQGGKGGLGPEDRRTLVTLLTWAKDQQIADNGNPIFLLARDASGLNEDLRSSDSGWRGITIARPDRAQREEYIKWYLDKRAEWGTPVALQDDLTIAEIANLTAGLSLRNIEDVLLVAQQAGGLNRRLLKRHKDEIVVAEYSEVAEMIDPLPGGFADLGGKAQLKAWAYEAIINPIREGRPDDVTRGFILVGPPGGGKTEFTKALSKEIGFAAVALNSSKILGGIVGESERKLAKFFDFCRSLAPVLVFMDEVDQSDMAQRGNNSGNPVAANLFNGMLQFMGDESLRGQIVMCFATNRPSLLDPAFKRNGRVDAIIPILLPDHDERVGIILSQAKRQKTTFDDPALVADLIAERTNDWSAADLAAVVRKARLKAAGKPIGESNALSALRSIRPSGKDRAREFTLEALDACTELELLPDDLQALAMESIESAEASGVDETPASDNAALGGRGPRKPRG